jgi:hypothetical protein
MLSAAISENSQKEENADETHNATHFVGHNNVVRNAAFGGGTRKRSLQRA